MATGLLEETEKRRKNREEAPFSKS